MIPVAAAISLFSGSAKKPLIIALAIIAVLVALGSAYFYVKNNAYENGYAIAEHKYLLEKEQAVTEAISQVNKKNKLNNEVAKTYWENKLAKKPKLKTNEKEVIKYNELHRIL